MKVLSTVVLVLSTAVVAYSQSTPSNWIRVSSNNESSFAGQSIALNNSYISIRIEKARVNPRANWWTNLVSRNRKAFITAEINATYPASPTFSDKRSSGGTDLIKSKVPIDIGWGRTLVQMLPTSFSSLNIKLALNTTATDGADDIVKVAQDVSNTTPPLSVAQNALGMVSGAKAVLDQLFNRRLANPQIVSDFDMVANSNLTNKPGYYVIFGGDVAGDYNKYISDPSKLKWDGNLLIYNGQQIDDVSYFVVLLESKKNYFDVRDINMLAVNKSPWARLYNETINIPDAVIDQTSYETSIALVRNNLINARNFLNGDDAYLPSERKSMHEVIVAEVQSKLKKRVDSFGLSTGIKVLPASNPTNQVVPAQAVPNPTVPSVSNSGTTPITAADNPVVVLSPIYQSLVNAQFALSKTKEMSKKEKRKAQIDNTQISAALEYVRLLQLSSLVDTEMVVKPVVPQDVNTKKEGDM